MDKNISPTDYETLFEETKRNLNRNEFSTIYKDALDGKSDAQESSRADIQSFLFRRGSLTATEDLIENLYNDIIEYGPITPYINAPSSAGISEIQVNGPYRIYIFQHGSWIRLKEVAFRSEEHFENVVKKITSFSDVSLGSANNYSDRAYLPNGSRVTIIRAPNIRAQYFLTIRTFNIDLFSTDKLIKIKSVSPLQDKLIKFLMRARANSLWTGGTNTGKTTHLGAYITELPNSWHIITVEDSPEFNLEIRSPDMHVTELYTREGESSFSWEDAYYFMLRSAPTVTFYGELRHPESTFRSINFMDTGHPGSGSSIHGGTAENAVENAVKFYHQMVPNLEKKMILETICKAVDFIPVMAFSRHNTRYMSNIVAIGWDNEENKPIYHPMITRNFDKNEQPVEQYYGIPPFLKKKLLGWNQVFEEDFEAWDQLPIQPLS